MTEKKRFIPACPHCGSLLNIERSNIEPEQFVCVTCGLRFNTAHMEQRLARPVTAGPFGEHLAREREIVELLSDIKDALGAITEVLAKAARAK